MKIRRISFRGAGKAFLSTGLIAVMVAAGSLTVYGGSAAGAGSVRVTGYEPHLDGSYALITTVVSGHKAKTIPAGAGKTKSASRIYTYYNRYDKKTWAMTLDATFTYNGSSSGATAVSLSRAVYIDSWKCTGKKVKKTGNTVKGTGRFTNGSTTVTRSIGMKCSKNGNITSMSR